MKLQIMMQKGIEHHLHHETQEIQGIYDRNEGQADSDY